ncbi:hypothetical protein MBLNU457_4656t1 [Dothideomycetes sp. NU457]
MTSTLPPKADVVIIGAGPSGLAAACKLRLLGINAIVLDGASGPATTFRATIVHSRTLEVLEAIGATTPLLETGVHVSKFVFRQQDTTIGNLDFSNLHARYPLALTLPQTDTERILRDRLQALGGSIHWNHSVSSLHDSEASVALQITTPRGATTLEATYLIAADGLHSVVRTSKAIAFTGGEYDISFITADCAMTSWPLPPDEVQACVGLDGFLLLIPEPGTSVYRIVATLDDAPRNPDLDLVQRILEKRAPKGVRAATVEASSRFHIHHRLAERYVDGRTFLVGDAAHVHSPAGGQGMNIGIQDGVAAADVIGRAILHGETAERDLRRYEELRRPVAKGVVALTHRLTLLVTLRNPLLCLLRNWALFVLLAIPFVRNGMTRRLAELD